ncbi:MAG: glycosyltransferase family 39 protein [Planctomycetes bacterium]|nr:glycosyltransferase family 39 protein [Planctomycetota bacterium]
MADSERQYPRMVGGALVGAIAALVMFANLGGPRLWDRDEPRNAGCAAEMFARNDWVTPVFNGELRGHKPVLLYWLMMGAYQVFGVNEFAARFWSATLAVVTCGLSAALGMRWYGRDAGVLSGIVLATSLMFGVAGRAATPDSVLVFTTAAALVWFAWWAVPKPGSTHAVRAGFPRSLPFAVVFHGILALGVLAKGPVGFVVPAAVVGTYLLITGDVRWSGAPSVLARGAMGVGLFVRTCASMRLLTASLMLLVIAGPWYAWVGLRTDGRFLYEFFIEHNWNRAREPMEGHGGPIVYYLGALCVGFFPWSVFLVPTLVESIQVVRRKIAGSDGALFLLCWLCVWIGIFSVAKTKLPSYITPSHPAIALLTAWLLDRWRRGTSIARGIWPQAAFVILGAVGVAMLVGLPIAARRYLPGDEWLAGLGVVPFTAAIAAAWLTRADRRSGAVAALAVGAVALGVGLFAIAAQTIDRHQQFDRLIGAVRADGAPVQLGALGVFEPSWVYYAGQPVRVVVDSPTQDSADRPNIERFLERRAAYVITTRGEFERRRGSWSPDLVVIEEVPYFLREERLVLLGRRSPQVARRNP